MRKSIITTLLFLLAITTAFAQPAKGGQRGAAEMLEALELTPEQQEQIKAIKKDTREQLKALRQEQQENGREQAKAIMQQSRKAVEGVLTPAQQAKFAELKAAKKAAWEAVDKAALKAELKAYREAKIEPVLRASRGKLDAFISAEDQAEIERLRGVFATRPGKKGERSARPENREDARKEMASRREAGKAWREAHADDVASLTALTKKYAAELKRVQDVLAPSRKTWGEDMAEIKQKYLPEGTADRGRKLRDRKARKAGKGERKGRGAERLKASAFLLMKA